MNISDIKAVKELLNSPKHIVIIPHKNPDGDAMGSTLALYHYLKSYNHKAKVIAPNDYPEFLKWLPGDDDVLIYENNTSEADKLLQNAEIIFTLDFNDLGRIGAMEATVSACEATFIMIDHHQQPSEYATYMYSDTSMSSTCEMVYNFIDFLEDSEKIDKAIATCLYTGIMTDTGSFRFSATTSTTHKIIADLMDKGAQNDAIHNAIYDTNNLSRMHLLGCALKNLVVLEAYNTVYITLSKEELQEFDFKKGDTEGFVNYGLSLKGIKFAAILIESLQEPYIKMSLRSKGDFSVNEIARKYFNGGGHTNAAGGRYDATLEETVTRFKEVVHLYKDSLS